MTVGEFLLGKLVYLIAGIIICIPFWIRLVFFKPYQPKVKRLVMIFMMLIATGYSMFVICHEDNNIHDPGLWAGAISMIIYLSAVFISAYYSWPRKNKSLTSEIYYDSKKETANEKSTMQGKNLVVIPIISGTYEEVSTSLINATFVVENENLQKFPYSDFGAWLMEEIHDIQKIFALKRGIFTKNYYCPCCDSELNLDTISSKRIEFVCNDNKIPEFTIQITIPSVVCSNCHKICAVDQKGILENYLGEALVKAFDSENIKR